MSALNRKHGHSVDVVSLDDPRAPWVADCSVTCHALGPGLGKYSYSSRFVPWLKANRHNYDVVVVNGIWQFNAFGVRRALYGTSTPYIVYTHGMLDPWFKRAYPLKHLKKWLYWPWGDYRVLRDAAAVLFTCEEERRLARGSFWLYRCNEFVANYGTAGPTGDPIAQRDLFLERFPEIQGKRCLIFLGRIHVKKGTEFVFQGFASALKRLPESYTRGLHLIIAGPNDHEYGKEMQRLAIQLGLASMVTWTGMIAGDLKWGAFYNSDAFILPSHQENFGISVVEAMACRVPVLISDQVNIWREICNDGAGFIDSDDVHGTRNLIERWLQTPMGEWEAMKGRAEKSFKARFNIEQAALSLVRAMEAFGIKSREQ